MLKNKKKSDFCPLGASLCEQISSASKSLVVNTISNVLVNIIPNGSVGPRVHGAIVNVVNTLENSDDPTLAVMFKKWLKATNKYSYRYYDKTWWSGLVQHSRNMENTALRMFCAFNQWYREAIGENCITMKDVEKYLKVMNTETNQFVDDCLVKEMTITYAPVAEMEEEEEDFSSLDQEFCAQ